MATPFPSASLPTAGAEPDHSNMNSMLPETVFLDAGGVLLFPNWSRISETLGHHGVEVDPKTLAAAEPHAKRRMDLDKTVQVTSDADRGWLYFNLILADAGITISSATDQALQELHDYHRVHNLWEFVPDDVLPALRGLRARGVGLTIVSNANCTLRALLDRVCLGSYFDCVIDSCEVGVEKPDPRIFDIALERSRARRETTIHVGDLYEIDVVGARAAGIRGVLLDQLGLSDVDCPRVRSLEELIRRLDAGDLR